MKFIPQRSSVFNEGAYLFVINLSKDWDIFVEGRGIFPKYDFPDREFIHRECFNFTLMSKGNVRSSSPIKLRGIVSLKHSFSFPKHIRESVKSHINKAIKETDINRYNQESQYVTALLAKMEGVLYNDSDFYIKIISTVINDRGKNSAESLSGADFSITAKISDKEKTIEKAIIFQAKMDEKDLKSSNLNEQIKK